MMHATVEQAVAIALGHYRAGRLAEAIAAFGQVAALVPDSAEAHSNLGIALRKAGRTDEAIAAYRRAIALRPDHAAAHNNLGNVLREAGRRDEAIAVLERAVTLEPAFAEAHNNRGVALHEAGRLDEAIAAFTRAIELRPDYGPAYNNLGSALADAHRHDEAVAAHDRAIEFRPDSALAHDNLGRTLRLQGRFDAAIAAHRRALEIDPEDALAYSHLGTTYREAGRPDEAIAACLRAIELDPQSAAAHGNLGSALNEAGRPAEAIAPLERALALKPDSAEVLNNLGIAWVAVGRCDLALDCFRRALERNPDHAPAASNRLFFAHYHPDHDAQTLLGEHRQWADRFAAPLADQGRPHPNDRTPDRRLTIGFVSPDLRSHPVGQALVPLFHHRDRRQVEFVVYSDVRVPDELTGRLKGLADQWLDTVSLSDPQLADRIRADRIDILVDPTLHTAHNRVLVFARKPAPVQVTMLGPPATTGLATMDYRLTDPYLDPSGSSDADYTERSIRLPHCFWIFQPPEPSPPVTPLPALRNGFITFGFLNQLAKVTRPTQDLWRKILQAIPGSRLVLQSPPGSHQAAIRAVFEDGGVSTDRLEFVARAPRLEYLCRFQNIDLGLDPFPYTGHTSTFDPLWMGVPVVTLSGRTGVGRGCASLLSNVGLTELIAQSPEQYVELAVALARDPARLAELRAGLRQRVQASPLVNGEQYATNVVKAFRRMWLTWCES
jgi:predicted O-linked N-acetylglucosamine transferase (SPINDLY family)